MRPAAAPATLSAVSTQRIILDAAIERAVIRGTMTVATGERRTFHGWLELNAALEAILERGADAARNAATEER
jgi:hypothetical protein